MRLSVLILLFIPFSGVAQSNDELIKEIKSFQAEQNEHYLNKETSPLKKKERRHFEGHLFYPIELSYRVQATFREFENKDTLVMKTSANTEKVYLRFGVISFYIGSVNCELVAYQNIKWSKKEGYENDLFVPFRDVTSGKESYGGGRYLDIKIPSTESLILNFNLAYNPYCAYTDGWFCCIPPAENTLKVEIKAGLKAPLSH